MKKKSINFERSLPNSNLINSVKLKKNFEKSLAEVRKNLKNKKNLFESFSKDFKLNFKLKELDKFKKFQRIIVIGLGGSILGAESIHHFLKSKIKKEVTFIDNLNTDLIEKVNNFKNLKKTLFILISKSGNTLELLSIVNALKEKAKFNKDNTLVITSDKKNQINTFAKKLNIKIITHRSHIGGRYSVFSETGLIPCYLLGLNIKNLKKNIRDYIQNEKTILIENLKNLSFIYSSQKINSLVLLSYCPGLEYFLLWCQQLIAESLGKNGKGLIPIISICPRDHHSLLQLYLDGPRDKFFYIFSSSEKKKNKKNGELFKTVLNNANNYEVLNCQKNSIISLFKEKKIPFLSISLNNRNEEIIGKLFSYFILETVCIAERLKLNPYNQPAVEKIKILTKNNLFKSNRK